MIAQSQGLANDDSQAKSNPLPAYLWPVSKDWFLCLKTVGKKSKEKYLILRKNYTKFKFQESFITTRLVLLI